MKASSQIDEVTAVSRARKPRWTTVVKGFLQEKPQYVLSPLLLIAILLAWELGVLLAGTPEYILPRPTQIADQLVVAAGDSSTWDNLGVTALEMMLGFGIAVAISLVLAVIVGIIPRIEAFIMPYIVAIQTVPAVSLAPILLLWFGFGITSKVLLAVLIAFFPIFINMVSGLKVNSEGQTQMLRSFGASRAQVLRMVRIPNALPYVFAGLEIGIVFALLGAVVGEFSGAQAGLGYQILKESYSFNISGMFSALIFLSVLGLTANFIVVLIQRRVVFWAKDTRAKM